MGTEGGTLPIGIAVGLTAMVGLHVVLTGNLGAFVSRLEGEDPIEAWVRVSQLATTAAANSSSSSDGMA